MSEKVKAGNVRLKMLQEASHTQSGSHASENLEIYDEGLDGLADAVGLLTIGQGGKATFHGETASSEVNASHPPTLPSALILSLSI